MPEQFKTTEEKSAGTIVYARCSTLEEGKNVESELRDHAAKLGLAVIGCVFDKLSGPPYSLLNLLRSGAFNGKRSILVPGFDCFGSEGINRDAIIHLLKRKGAAVVSPGKRPPIPATERYINAINDYYSFGGDREAEKAGKSQSDDRPTAGRTVFGYENVDGTIRIKRETSEIVEYLFCAYAQGKPLTEIKNAMDVSFPNSPRPSLSQLYGMIKNEVYAGANCGARSVYPPIVPMNVWLKCAALNEKRSGKDADEFLFPFIEYAGGTKLYPCTERSGLRKRVYRSTGLEAISFPADQIEIAVIESINRKLDNALPVLIEKCTVGARNELIKCSSELARANSDHSIHERSFTERYSSSCELPYGNAVSEFEREKARLELERICIDYLKCRQHEFSLTKEKINEYFEHLSRLCTLSRCEQKYFISTLVRKVRIADEKLQFSVPGFEPFSVRIGPEQ